MDTDLDLSLISKPEVMVARKETRGIKQHENKNLRATRLDKEASS